MAAKDYDKNKSKSSSSGSGGGSKNIKASASFGGGGSSSKSTGSSSVISGSKSSFTSGSKSSYYKGAGTTVSVPSSSKSSQKTGVGSSLGGHNKPTLANMGTGITVVDYPRSRLTVTMGNSSQTRSPFGSYNPTTQLTYDSKPGEFVARSLYFGANGQAQRGQDLFRALQQEFTNFESPLYQPYFQPTSKALRQLAALGVDVPASNVGEWFEMYRGSIGTDGRFTADGKSPAGHARSSTWENDVAHWMYKLEDDLKNTEKAKQEWANLQKELSYKASRLDWNLSDDEIIASIDWKKYPTLEKLNNMAKDNLQLEAGFTTEGMDYSRDNLYGVLFAARNPENTSDNAYINTGWYYTKAGNTYLQNDAVRNASNPNSPDYNPYRYGPSRVTDATMEYFGVPNIDQKFLDDHKYMMNSADAKERTMYSNAVEYFQNWEKIEAQTKELTDAIEEGLKYFPRNANGLIDYVFGDGGIYEDLDMLQKVDESFKTGNFVGTAQAISYDRRYIENRIHEICGPSYEDYSGAEKISFICDKLGVDKTGITYDPVIDHEMDKAINESAGYIAKNGTSEEKDVFQNAYLYNYDNYIREVADAIVDGRMTSQEAFDQHMQYANDLCFTSYAGAKQTVDRYEYLRKEKDALIAQLTPGNIAEPEDEQYTEQVRQENFEIQKQIEEIDAELLKLTPDHEEALDTLKKIDQSYEFADRIAALGAVVVPENQKFEARAMIDYISQYDGELSLPEYSAYSAYEMDLESGTENYASIAERAKNDIIENNITISSIDYFLKWVTDNNVAVPERAIENMKTMKEQLERNVSDSEYFLMQDNDDFESVASAKKKEIKDKFAQRNWFEQSLLGLGSWDESETASAIAMPDSVFGFGMYDGNGLHWTEAEENTYMYLYAKEGEEKAEEYANFLKNRVKTREYENIQQWWRDNLSGGNKVDSFGEHVVSGIVGTLTKPFADVTSALYTIGQMATGNQIYTKDPMFALSNVITDMRGETKEALQNKFDDPNMKAVMGFLHDVSTSALDSLYTGSLAGMMGLSSVVSSEALFSGAKNGLVRKIGEKLPKSLNAFFAASLQGSATIAQTAQDLARRGIDDTTAYWLACGINFMAETATEAIEVSDILNIDDSASFKALWGDGKKFQAICRLCQIDDAFGESASEFITGLSDYFITEKAAKYDLSTDEGRRQFLKDIIYSGFSGAVSAGLSSGASSLVRNGVNSHNEKQARLRAQEQEQQARQRIDDMINNLDFGNGPRNQPQNQTQEQTRQEPDWYDMQLDEVDDMDESETPAQKNQFEGISTQDLSNEFFDLRDRIKSIQSEMAQNNEVLEGEDRAVADQQVKEMTAEMRKRALAIRDEVKSRYADTYDRLRSLLTANGGVMDEGAVQLKAEADELERIMVAGGVKNMNKIRQNVDNLITQPAQDESAPQETAPESNEPDWYNRETEEEEIEYPQHNRSKFEGRSTEDVMSELTELVARIEQTKNDLADQYKLVDKKDKKYVREQNQDILNQLDDQSRELCQELADRYIDTYTRLTDLLNANGGDMDESAMQLQAEADAIDKTLSYVGMDMNGIRQNIDDMITSRSGAEEAEVEALPESNNTQVSPEQVQMIRTVNALFNADQSGDQAAKSITLSSVLALSNSDHSITSLDRAGGMALARDYGDKIPQLSYLFLSAVENGQNFEDVANALSIAALKVDGTQSGQFLDLLMQKDDTHYTKEEIDGLILRSLADINDPLLNTALLNKIVDYDTAFKVKDKIAQGRRKNSKTAKQRAKVARDQGRRSAEKLAESQKQLLIARQNLQVASQQFHDNPGDSALFGAQGKAQQDVVGRVNEVENNRESAQAAEETAIEAQKNADEIASQEMTEIRQEARAEAEQEMAERRQERAEQRRAESTEQAQGGARQGYTGTTYVGSQPVQFHYAAIDADGLVVSNDASFAPNPNYPAELQPRDRTRAADQMNISNMAKTLIPERLGESSSVQEGAPVVGPDFVVESGNGRVLAINQARGSESGARYTTWLRDNAAKFGLNPEDISDRSVLVRVRDTDVDRVEFARQANESNTASYSETETAVNDAKALGNDIINKFNGFNSKGSVNTLSNREFIADFVNKIIPKSQRSQYLTETGELNTRGETRIMNAVFAKAYGDTRLISMLAEGSDESKNFLKAMREVAPNVAMLDARVKAGEAFKTDLSERITDAVKLLRDVYASGNTLADRLDQVSMFDEGENNGINPVTAELARFLDKNKRSATKIADGLLTMVDKIYDAGIPGQLNMMGEEAPAPQLLPIIKKTAADIASGNVLKAVSDHTVTVPAAPVQSDNPRVQRDIQSGWDIIQRLSDSIGVPIDPRRSKYLRNLRRNTGGYIHPDAKVVHVQDASMVEIAMHELGHVISQVDDLANRLDTRGLLANLMNIPQEANFLSLYYDPNDVQGSQQVIEEECRAEFAKFWALDRDYAVQLAGQEFVDQWESLLNDRGWLAPMQEASVQLRLNRAQTVTDSERARSYIHLEDQNNKSQPTMREWVRKALTQVSDYTHPLQQITDENRNIQGENYRRDLDPRELALARATASNNLFERNLFETMVDSQGNTVYREDGTEYGSFQSIISQINDTDEQDFMTLWSLLDARDRHAQGKDTFGDDFDIDRAIQQLQQAHPDFMPVIDQAVEWYEKFMETWLVNENNQSAEAFRHMREMYPYYIPSVVDVDENNVGSTRNRRGDQTADTGLRAAHGHKGAAVKNPIVEMTKYMQSYISKAKTIEMLRAFDTSMTEALRQDPQWANGIAELTQPDMNRVNTFNANQEALRALNREIRDIMRDRNNRNDPHVRELMDRLRTTIMNLPNYTWEVSDRATGADVINVVRADGSIASWTVYNKDVYDALTKMPSGRSFGPLIRGVNALVRLLCANATGRDVGFAVQNFLGDTDTVVNYGHSAGNYFQYLGQLGRNAVEYGRQMYREHRGQETSDTYRKFKTFGQLGSRYILKNRNTARDIRRQLYNHNTRVRDIVSTIIHAPIAATEFASGFLEDITRFNAFANNYSNGGSYSDALRAGRYAREDSVDFSKVGKDDTTMPFLKQIIPFIGASTQGMAKTIETFVLPENREERNKLLARTALNGLIRGVAFAVLRGFMWDDDEKDAFDEVRDSEKAKYFHIKVGNGENAHFFRVKRSQDAFIQTAENIGEMIGRTFTGWEDDPGAAIFTVGKNAAMNAMLSFDTVWQPFVDVANNRTFADVPIDSAADLKKPPQDRYDAETPYLFRMMSSLSNVAGVPFSPAGWRYLTEEFTGSMGRIGINIFENMTNDNQWLVPAVGEAMIDYAARKFTIDPVYSNSLSETYYAGLDKLDKVLANAEAGHSIVYFRSNLSKDEVTAGLKEAKDMTGSQSRLGVIGTQIADLRSKEKEVLDDNSKTESARDVEARAIRMERNKLMLEANAIIGDYFQKYGYDYTMQENLMNAAATFSLARPVKIESNMIPQTVKAGYVTPETMHDVFKADSNMPYMQKAMGLYESTQDAAVLPHPKYTGSYNKVKYEVEEQYQNDFDKQYRDAYNSYVKKKTRAWDRMTEKEKTDVMTYAHNHAQQKASEWYHKLKR